MSVEEKRLGVLIDKHLSVHGLTPREKRELQELQQKSREED